MINCEMIILMFECFKSLYKIIKTDSLISN